MEEIYNTISTILELVTKMEKDYDINRKITSEIIVELASLEENIDESIFWVVDMEMNHSWHLICSKTKHLITEKWNVKEFRLDISTVIEETAKIKNYFLEYMEPNNGFEKVLNEIINLEFPSLALKNPLAIELDILATRFDLERIKCELDLICLKIKEEEELKKIDDLRLTISKFFEQGFDDGCKCKICIEELQESAKIYGGSNYGRNL